jgi:hypothetical protein
MSNKDRCLLRDDRRSLETYVSSDRGVIANPVPRAAIVAPTPPLRGGTKSTAAI